MLQKIFLFLLTVILPFALSVVCFIIFWGQNVDIFLKLSVILFLLTIGLVSLIVWLWHYCKPDNILGF